MTQLSNGRIVKEIMGIDPTDSDASWPAFKLSANEKIDELERRTIHERKIENRFEKIEKNVPTADGQHTFTELDDMTANLLKTYERQRKRGDESEDELEPIETDLFLVLL